MKLNIQSMHTPGLLLATNLVQLANSIAHARSLVTAAYSHAREIATAEANHEAADFCGDPYAHNCGRPHCRPSDSYTGPQPPLARRFFEVGEVAEAAPPAAGVPIGMACKINGYWEAQLFAGHGCIDRQSLYAHPLPPADVPTGLAHRLLKAYDHGDTGAIEAAIEDIRTMLAAAPTPPASEQQREVAMPEGDEHEDHSASTAAIQFALELEDLEDIPAFLSMWNEGEFETIRRAWPDCPDEVFIGADPLFKPAAPSQGESE